MAFKTLCSPTLRGLALALVALAYLLPAVAAPTFPTLTGRVVDNAELLSPQDRKTLSEKLKELEEKSSDQLVVVTLPTLQGYTIEDFGYQLGRHWGIGTAKLNNGVLLVVAPNERKVRIEVGYGLEPVLTDALSKIIIENAILPRFRAGNFADGIKDGVDAIALALTTDPAEAAARARARRDADDPAVDWFMVITYLVIFLLIAYTLHFGSPPVSSTVGRKGSSRSSSGGGSSGGSFGGGSSGGGGFSGGGGSFGGGGSSGSW